MSDQPLISCLMVTKGPARLPFLRRSIADYCRQTHPRSELVVIVDPAAGDGARLVGDFIGSLGRRDIRVEPAEGAVTLGALRNRSRAAARGDIHCQWDDDDLNHPERLAQQLACLTRSGAAAICLEQVMNFLPARRTLYCQNWRATEAKGFPATMMCRADAPVRYAEEGELARRGEDTDLVMQFQRLGAYRTLAGAAHLYVYVSHGQNTWSEAHHCMLTERLGMSRALLLRSERELREGLKPHDLGPALVAGPNGAAFELASQAEDAASCASTSTLSR